MFPLLYENIPTLIIKIVNLKPFLKCHYIAIINYLCQDIIQKNYSCTFPHESFPHARGSTSVNQCEEQEARISYTSDMNASSDRICSQNINRCELKGRFIILNLAALAVGSFKFKYYINRKMKVYAKYGCWISFAI